MTDEDDEVVSKAVTNGMIEEAGRKRMKGDMTRIDEVSRAETITDEDSWAVDETSRAVTILEEGSRAVTIQKEASVAVTGGENEIIKMSQAVTLMGRDGTEDRDIGDRGKEYPSWKGGDLKEGEGGTKRRGGRMMTQLRSLRVK